MPIKSPKTSNKQQHPPPQQQQQQQQPHTRCPHVVLIGNIYEDDLNEIIKNAKCDECGETKKLSVCLRDSCMRVFCSSDRLLTTSDDNNELYLHYQTHINTTYHPLLLNIDKKTVWCDICGSDIDLDRNIPSYKFKRKQHDEPTKQHKKQQHQQQQQIFDNKELLNILKTNLSNDDSQSLIEEDNNNKDDDDRKLVNGLIGLQNIGNTCYLNAALQALSNCCALTNYFIECSDYVIPNKLPRLSMVYMKLINQMWMSKQSMLESLPVYRRCLTPSEVLQAIRYVNPMFKGYAQQDAQELLICLLEQVHEELKRLSFANNTDQTLMNNNQSNNQDDNNLSSASNSDGEDTDSYETCDSIPTSQSSSSTTNEMIDNDNKLTSPTIDVDTDSTVTTQINSNDNPTNSSDSGVDSNSQQPSIKTESEQSELNYDLKTNGNCSETGTTENNNNNSNDTNSVRQQQQQKATTKKSQRRVRVTRLEASSSISSGASTTSENIRIEDIHLFDTNYYYTNADINRFNKNLDFKMFKKSFKNYTSIISDIFTGKMISQVQCLKCERISNTVETIQGLSLPIPTKEYLQALQTKLMTKANSNDPNVTTSAPYQGWFSWMMSFFKSSGIWGPTIKLEDCLTAFFAADDLKGDNMYNCEKCKKLSDGIKYSKLLGLPETLCVHLKRFRHDYVFSSKIGTYVQFPLESLDLSDYLHKECKNQSCLYDLYAVICHHGGSDGGHYTCYALNYIDLNWYEYDDSCCTQVDEQIVRNLQAYVLFYKKKNARMTVVKSDLFMLIENNETSEKPYYISKQWINKLKYFAEPGPITNHDFICSHGAIYPDYWPIIDDLTVIVTETIWKYLTEQFKYDIECNSIEPCRQCQLDFELIKQKRYYEKTMFNKLSKLEDNLPRKNSVANSNHNNSDSIDENTDNLNDISSYNYYYEIRFFAISHVWIKEWDMFVLGKLQDPPGPINNLGICTKKNGIYELNKKSNYYKLNEEIWKFLHRIYGGGPILPLKTSSSLFTQSIIASSKGSNLSKSLSSYICKSKLNGINGGGITYKTQKSVVKTQSMSILQLASSTSSSSSTYNTPLSLSPSTSITLGATAAATANDDTSTTTTATSANPSPSPTLATFITTPQNIINVNNQPPTNNTNNNNNNNSNGNSNNNLFQIKETRI